MKSVIVAASLLGFMAVPAYAEYDITRLASDADVNTSAERLVEAVEGAGAKVFARIDHGEGARSIDQDVGDSQLIIFGNPKVGTPLIEDDRLAGLLLPLKILIYQDESGKVWVAYENVPEQFADLAELDNPEESLKPIEKALAAMSAAASGQPE